MSKGKTILDLLGEIRRRPGLFLGGRSVNLLKAFIDGFYYCKHVFGVPVDREDKIMGGFQDWVARKYKVKSTQSWAQIILFYSVDESDAFSNFFLLLKEYLEAEGVT